MACNTVSPDDPDSGCREEAVRCVGSYLHYCAGAGQAGAVAELLASLVLHMDDEAEGMRDLVLGCLVSLPGPLHPALREAAETARASQAHPRHLDTLLAAVQT